MYNFCKMVARFFCQLMVGHQLNWCVTSRSPNGQPQGSPLYITDSVAFAAHSRERLTSSDDGKCSLGNLSLPCGRSRVCCSSVLVGDNGNSRYERVHPQESWTKHRPGIAAL